jgi:FMN phosphatase YigB (HAD superfamily)
MPLDAVLFDLGGTLLHYHDPASQDPQRPFRHITLEGVRAVDAHLPDFGFVSPGFDALSARVDVRIAEAYRDKAPRSLSAGSVEGSIRGALADLGISPTDDQWAGLRRHFYAVIDTIVIPRAGLHETLAALAAAGCRMGIISNTFWAADLHDRHLAEHGILRYFPLRIYSCDTPYMKPHPAIFKLALDALEITPRQAAYVGDRPDVDVRGAQNAGLFGVLIDSPYRTEALDGVQPDAVVEELPGLPAALEAIGSRV